MEPRLGIYIHIPFCASKCGYCDFYSCAGAADRMADYQHALLEHIEESAGRIAPAYIDTVYFGGGTPSFYGAARLIELLDAVKATGRLLKRAEVTVEVNPDSVRLHDLRALHKAGFNRLSIGMQSANNDILKMIGRRHSFRQVEMAVQNARTAGFDNISLDLIYGLPSQTRSDWADTLAKALALRPEHISGYGLKLEEGTPMYALKDSPLIPSDDEQADMYLCMVEELRRYGYEQYEISNFSIPGYESRHNLKYWQLDDYMGFGPGAHSCIGRTRYSYVRDLDRYLAGVLHGEDMIDEYETVGDFERAAEYLTGEHDYRSFCSNPQMKKSTVRIVDSIEIVRRKEYLYFNYHGTGFLQNMVRILTGTLLEVGQGKRTPESVRQTLEAKDRTQAGYTAPPQGLCLMRVDY